MFRVCIQTYEICLSNSCAMGATDSTTIKQTVAKPPTSHRSRYTSVFQKADVRRFPTDRFDVRLGGLFRIAVAALETPRRIAPAGGGAEKGTAQCQLRFS